MRIGKTNVLLNVIKHQRPDIDKIYSYVKDPIESKYQLLINGRKKVGIEDLKDSEAFIDYPQTIIVSTKIWKTISQQRRGEC